MGQLIEFIGNHPLPVVAFLATLGMLSFTEYTRLFSGTKALAPYVATKLLNTGEAVFVDVRTDGEYKKGHIINARSMPVNNLDKHIHELEKFKEKDIVVYCDTGMRASKAAGKLKKSGFTRLNTIAGGLAAWEKASLPVVSK